MSSSVCEGSCAQPEHFRRFNLRQFLDANECEPDITVAADDGRFVPTDAWPGSAEKRRVLAERFAMGLPLWHVDDAKWGDGADE